MNKYEEALNRVKEGYDAYLIQNKYASHYTQTTHSDEFDLLKNLKGEKVVLAIHSIARSWDCYYADELQDETGTPFEYLRNLCREVKE